jgi:hypothetical protein
MSSVGAVKPFYIIICNCNPFKGVGSDTEISGTVVEITIKRGWLQPTVSSIISTIQ